MKEKTSTSTRTISKAPRGRRQSPAVASNSHHSQRSCSQHEAKQDGLIGSHLAAQMDGGPTTDRESEAGDSQGEEMKTSFRTLPYSCLISAPKEDVFLFQSTTMQAEKPPVQPKAASLEAWRHITHKWHCAKQTVKH